MGSKPLIFAFVSGKGGVGKTMLAVAFAKELSLQVPTLIIDLDFFNRGLTGLMRFGERARKVARPDFLRSDENVGEGEEWTIVQVAKKLFHVSYPDLLPEEMRAFETLDVNRLAASFLEFVLRAAAECSCECIVLDCHGGPDNSSFAACLCADYSLLVSEPDRITFYGTLNFIRQLKQMEVSGNVNLWLIFNKVVPAFSALFLTKLYNKLMRPQFGGHPLLAVFPLEVYLTKEFEKTPLF